MRSFWETTLTGIIYSFYLSPSVGIVINCQKVTRLDFQIIYNNLKNNSIIPYVKLLPNQIQFLDAGYKLAMRKSKIVHSDKDYVSTLKF